MSKLKMNRITENILWLIVAFVFWVNITCFVYHVMHPEQTSMQIFLKIPKIIFMDNAIWEGTGD